MIPRKKKRSDTKNHGYTITNHYSLDELVVEVHISVLRVGCSPFMFGYNIACRINIYLGVIYLTTNANKIPFATQTSPLPPPAKL